MNTLKYNAYFFFLIFFFLIIGTKNSYSLDLGLKGGFSFQSFYLDSKNNAIEDSGFGFDSSVFTNFLVHPRVLIQTEVGFSYYSNFYSPYIGLLAAFVIYPDYLPFIGLSVKEQVYNQIFNKTWKWNTSLYFSAGSKLFSIDNHSIWMFFEYLIFQSLYKTYNSSRFSLNFGYSYTFKSS